jgi:flagellar biosynthesis/type III secretory pathway protein FliH
MDDSTITRDEAARVFKAQMDEAAELQEAANERIKQACVSAVRDAYNAGYDAGLANGCRRAFEKLSADELRTVIAQAEAAIAARSVAA